MSEHAKEKKPTIFIRIAKLFRDMKGEVKKVVWPSKKQIINNTTVVIVVIIIAAIFVGAIDLGLGQLVRIFLRS